jgi:hypothetical protein
VIYPAAYDSTWSQLNTLGGHHYYGGPCGDALRHLGQEKYNSGQATMSADECTDAYPGPLSTSSELRRSASNSGLSTKARQAVYEALYPRRSEYKMTDHLVKMLSSKVALSKRGHSRFECDSKIGNRDQVREARTSMKLSTKQVNQCLGGLSFHRQRPRPESQVSHVSGRCQRHQVKPQVDCLSLRVACHRYASAGSQRSVGSDWSSDQGGAHCERYGLVEEQYFENGFAPRLKGVNR